MNRFNRLFVALIAGTVFAMSAPAFAFDDDSLARVVDQRLLGDRTGACFAVAVVQGDEVARAWRCADPADVDRIGPEVAFEIGSIAKTMTATLLADLIVRGEASLDDPLADYLPAGTQVPDHEGQPILLRHVVTHTSGLPALPSRMRITDMADPYAALDVEALLGSLADVTLDRAPGAQFEYSNFASMLLSLALARQAGVDFEQLIDQRLFTPLGMEHAYITRRPEGVRAAAGHLPNGNATSAWNIPVDMAGVGGVRATLDDMVRYAQEQLGSASSIAQATALAQQPVAGDGGPPMAMNWGLASIDGRTVYAHEGGTGGFSSLLSFDPERQRAVVVLSDTSLTALGGLGSLGQHLLDDSQALGKPRRALQAPDELIDALVGDYRVDGGMRMTLVRSGDGLALRVAGQPEHALGHDDAGDFYPLHFDALLTPNRRSDGSYGFVWHQGGGAITATRIEAGEDEAPAAALELAPEALREYAGSYGLMPGFDLSVRERDGGLYAQATGQGEFELTATAADVFEAPAFGIEIRFGRDDAGEVVKLDLHQGGAVLSGERQ